MMKFRAHETFFIRKGWLSKGVKSVLKNPNVFMGLADDGTAKINSMDALGIGANMVKSLRYWLQAVGLTEEPLAGKKSQTLTPLGELIHKHDPYMEEMGTLCLLHHRLCTKEAFATSWYYFFNEFSLKSFAREDFVTAIKGYTSINDETVSGRSLEDDFNCIIGTYISRERGSNVRVSPENNIDCPLGDLELIKTDNRKSKTYKKQSASKTVLPPVIALGMILEWADGRRELPISELLNNKKSIGRVFNLDTIELSSLLFDLETGGYLKIIHTAGLDVVRVQRNMTYLQCVENYYKSIN